MKGVEGDEVLQGSTPAVTKPACWVQAVLMTLAARIFTPGDNSSEELWRCDGSHPEQALSG